MRFALGPAIDKLLCRLLCLYTRAAAGLSGRLLKMRVHLERLGREVGPSIFRDRLCLRYRVYIYVV